VLDTYSATSAQTIHNKQKFAPAIPLNHGPKIIKTRHIERVLRICARQLDMKPKKSRISWQLLKNMQTKPPVLDDPQRNPNEDVSTPSSPLWLGSE